MSHDDHDEHGSYYVPAYSAWPILAAIALFILGLGSIEFFGAGSAHSTHLLIGGGVFLLLIMVAWMRSVIKESRRGLYDDQMRRTFRWGMIWFLFSDFMLFFGLLGALWYTRIFNLPQLAGTSTTARMMTHFLLWPSFVGQWPLLVNPDPTQFAGPQQGLMFNWQAVFTTIVLILSGASVFLARFGLRNNRRGLLIAGSIAAFMLAFIFLTLEINTLYLAMTKFGLTIGSGIYGSIVVMGSVIFMLHLLVAALLMMVVAARSMMGHFSNTDDFSVKAISWFWTLLVFVWIAMFLSVY